MTLLRVPRFVWNHPLNARGKWAAIRRLIWWQAVSRVKAGPIPLPFVEGTRLFAVRGMTGATGNWYCGLHEASEMAFALHVLRRGEHFLDVGANVGSYTVLAGGAAGARVTAVEPIGAAFESLKRNVALNGLNGSVCCHHVGLSERKGTLRFSSTEDTVNHVLAEGEELPGIDVPVATLDELLGGDAPVLAKIDVEGHELAVLRGARVTLNDPRLLAVIMETNGSGARYGIADDELVSEMRHHGFLPCGYDPFGRRLLDSGGENGNTVFVRDRAAIEARVAAAPRFRLVNGTI